jgi:hypothetical protein
MKTTFKILAVTMLFSTALLMSSIGSDRCVLNKTEAVILNNTPGASYDCSVTPNRLIVPDAQ